MHISKTNFSLEVSPFTNHLTVFKIILDIETVNSQKFEIFLHLIINYFRNRNKYFSNY